MSRDEFLDRLKRLLPSQFEELVFRLAVPPEYLAPSTTPLATRAIDLLRYLEGAGRLTELASYLNPTTRQGAAAATPAASAAARPSGAAGRTQVFVSYARQDAPWLKRLQVHFKPLENQGLCELWDDTRIQPGMIWREEIEKALERARVAVLLVSADFLASDFIQKNELPPLLNRAASVGVRILPIIVRPCLFEHSGLEKYQAVHPPNRPLSSMDRDEAEDVLVKSARFLMEYFARSPSTPVMSGGTVSGHIIQLEKSDSVLWLTPLAEAGLQIPPGTACILEVNGTLIEFIPMNTGTDGRPTSGLKAHGENAALWNGIALRTRLTIRLHALRKPPIAEPTS